MADTKTLPKLILHFDVNETIMIGDPAGGDTLQDCLNKIVCKNAYVKGNEATSSHQDTLPTQWFNGAPIDSKTPPPLHTAWEVPSGCVSYYRSGYNAVDPYKKVFTEEGQPGSAYRYAYEQMSAALQWPTNTPSDHRLCHDGVHHFLLPAFFHTITTLAEQGRSFSIVVRTFGSDADDVAHALTAFAEGKHLSSLGSGVSEMKLDITKDVWNGFYHEDGTFRLRQGSTKESKGNETQKGEATPAKELGELDALRMIEARDKQISCVVCTDDYKWWKGHGYLPSAGKPMWLTRDDEATHHIFFDDNIHNLAHDSIVAVRVRDSGDQPFQAMSGADTLGLQGIHLVRTPTIEPILNKSWFLEQIAKCEKARAGQSTL